jgi:murein endopeptidase/LysM repeat protein
MHLAGIAHTPSSPALRGWCAWVVLLVLCAGWAAPAVAEAATAPASSSKKKASAKKPASGKKPASTKKPTKPAAPAPVRPVARDAWGPQAVPDGEAGDTAGEGDLDDEAGGDTVSAESELEAIERELLAQASEPEPDVSYVEPPPPAPSKPRSIKHVLIPGETLDDVARRYQVEVGDLEKWNALKRGAPIPSKKKDLRVITSHTPPPREKLEHVVKRGDTWDKIAAEFGLDVAELRRMNPRLGDKLDPAKKHKVVAWRDLDTSPAAALSAKLAQLRVRAGGISIGKPNRGRLVRGVQLPDRPDLYVRRKPDEAYGSTHTIMQTLVAVTRFRHESGYKGNLVIGAMSRPKGGRFRPHKSHQSGRDVDIRLPLLASAQGKKHTTAADVDWRATWQLMRAFLDTGQVEYIFLDFNLQKRIYKAARESGVSREQLDLWLEWPVRVKNRKNKRVVIRHVEGHTSHMHVRIRCGPKETHCQATR